MWSPHSGSNYQMSAQQPWMSKCVLQCWCSMWSKFVWPQNWQNEWMAESCSPRFPSQCSPVGWFQEESQACQQPQPTSWTWVSLHRRRQLPPWACRWEAGQTLWSPPATGQRSSEENLAVAPCPCSGRHSIPPEQTQTGRLGAHENIKSESYNLYFKFII